MAVDLPKLHVELTAAGLSIVSVIAGPIGSPPSNLYTDHVATAAGGETVRIQWSSAPSAGEQTTATSVVSSHTPGVGGASVSAWSGVCNVRMTVTSGSPISDGTSTTLYIEPFGGNTMGLYDAVNGWLPYGLEPRSIASGSFPAGTDKNYDIFAYYSHSVGGVTYEAVAWSTDTARATSLTKQDGVYVKSGSPHYRYIGTVRRDGSSVIHDSTSKRWVWNYYNRVIRAFSLGLSGSGYTYSTSSWRSLNNDTANRVSAVFGVAETVIDLQAAAYVDSTVVATRYVGIDEDGTATSDASPVEAVSKAELEYARAYMTRYPALGYHYYQVTEYGGGSGTQTWYSPFIIGRVVC